MAASRASSRGCSSSGRWQGRAWREEQSFYSRLEQHSGMQQMSSTEAVLSPDSRGRELEFGTACDGYPPAGCGEKGLAVPGCACTSKQHPAVHRSCLGLTTHVLLGTGLLPALRSLPEHPSASESWLGTVPGYNQDSNLDNLRS